MLENCFSSLLAENLLGLHDNRFLAKITILSPKLIIFHRLK